LDVFGLILAGGLGRRMGGVDKGLIPIGGRPMLEYVISRLRPQCGGLVLNANGDPRRFSAFGLPVVADSVPGYAGPLAGVLAGLDWLADHHPEGRWMVSVAADTPFFPGNFVQRLIEARVAEDVQMACAASGGRPHPVFALWSVEMRADLRNALAQGDGIRKVMVFVERYRFAIAEWPAEPLDPFFNVNTQEDVAQAEALAHRR
jgi:molybdopterin-guanine dinucleotide biosynthesis protein A